MILRGRPRAPALPCARRDCFGGFCLLYPAPIAQGPARQPPRGSLLLVEHPFPAHPRRGGARSSDREP
ncbi:hypothetical protein RC1_3359 [Rhodospirillum centenum SW]|uniref:Uncharacterized protein n=1 Tax=Rhodospirillum centenum (strain ATCC 51521 / SW) TaxID=414684 RepID=B6IWP5_RHOCS|nr:hypothetical protein RC1_3359 [Rhodospirillum centenum SW]